MNFHKLKGKAEIIYSPSGTYEESTKELTPGVYSVTDVGGMFSGIIPCFSPILINDNLINFENGVFKDIMQQVDSFLKPGMRNRYKDMGVCYKTGMILYGPPGTGKTSVAISAMLEMVRAYGVISLDFTGASINFITHVLNKIRTVQPTPIIVFVDEIDNSILNQEYYWLPFLDGTASVDGVIVLGCTNFINSIPDRIKNRKSRINKLFEVNSLPLEVYREYFTSRFPKLDSKIREEFCFKAEEARLNIDQFKNALIEYYIYELSIDKALDSVKKYSIDSDL